MRKPTIKEVTLHLIGEKNLSRKAKKSVFGTRSRTRKRVKKPPFSYSAYYSKKWEADMKPMKDAISKNVSASIYKAFLKTIPESIIDDYIENGKHPHCDPKKAMCNDINDPKFEFNRPSKPLNGDVVQFLVKPV